MWGDEVNSIPHEGIGMPPADLSPSISWNVAGSIMGAEQRGKINELAEEGMGVGNDLGAEL